MILVVAKGVGIWSIMVIAAILNGLARDKLLTPLIGSAVSLPLSGITLSGLVFIISYFTIPFFGEVKPGVYFIIGLSWVVMTLAFEYLFGHFVVGKPWHEINQVFNLAKGDLFIIVLFISAISPWMAAKLRHLV